MPGSPGSRVGHGPSAGALQLTSCAGSWRPGRLKCSRYSVVLSTRKRQNQERKDIVNQAFHCFVRHTSQASADISFMNDPFATEPQIAVRSAERRVDEEELHRLFELAIGDRIRTTGLQFKHVRASGPVTGVSGRFVRSTAAVPLRQRTDTGVWSLLFGQKLRRTLILASLALCLLLSGFDLMGLLVLHMR